MFRLGFARDAKIHNAMKKSKQLWKNHKYKIKQIEVILGLRLDNDSDYHDDDDWSHKVQEKTSIYKDISSTNKVIKEIHK